MKQELVLLKSSIMVRSKIKLVYTLTHLDYMRNTQLYSLLKTLPKAVMHHNHFDCNED